MTPRTLLQRFAPRLLLALLLGFSAEILMWAGAANRSATDSLLVVLGLAAASLILFDIMVRWHVRDLYGVAALGGLFALSYITLFNPIAPTRDIELALLIDVMGGQALLAMGVLLLFFVLSGTAQRWAWLGLPLGGFIGACWGVWMRWAAISGDWGARPVTLEAMLLIGGGVWVMIAITAWVCQRVAPIAADSLQMGAYEALFAGGVVILALYRQFDEQRIDVPIYLVFSGLGAICTAMLWSRKDSYFTWIPDPWQPKPAWLPFILTGVLFLLAAGTTFSLPPTETDSLSLFDAIRLGFALFGLLWLPGLALLLGLKAILRDIQSQPL